MKYGLKAFTLAEILISITIIGVVAALTLPALQVQLQETIIKIRKKALHNRTTQAMAMIEDLKAYKSAFDFVDTGYREVYKIDRICGTAEIPVIACNLPENIMREDGTSFKMPAKWSELNPDLINLNYEDETGIYSYSQKDSASAAFVTDNGESVNLFYNPDCRNIEQNSNNGYYAGTYACINLIFDVNGGDVPPNQIGKDIGFITVFGAHDPEVATAVPYTKNLGPINYSNTKNICKSEDSGYRLPDEYELASMYVNSKIFNLASDGAVGFWSSIPTKNNDIYYMHAQTGYIEPVGKDISLSIRCIQK